MGKDGFMICETNSLRVPFFNLAVKNKRHGRHNVYNHNHIIKNGWAGYYLHTTNLCHTLLLVIN